MISAVQPEGRRWGRHTSGAVVKLHLEPWMMKKCSVFDGFRDVVYGCPSYKILTKVRIVKIASLEAIGSPSGTKGVPSRLHRCL